MSSCKECQYFIMRPEHIAQKTKVFGHCTMPRIKIKAPDSPSCLRFLPNSPSCLRFLPKQK